VITTEVPKLPPLGGETRGTDSDGIEYTASLDGLGDDAAGSDFASVYTQFLLHGRASPPDEIPTGLPVIEIPQDPWLGEDWA